MNKKSLLAHAFRRKRANYTPGPSLHAFMVQLRDHEQRVIALDHRLTMLVHDTAELAAQVVFLRRLIQVSTQSDEADRR